MSAAVVAPSANWPGYDMTEVFGPLYLGTVVSLILSGITIMQAYAYFPSNDRLFLQIVAAGMIIFDLVSTGLIAQGVYSYVVPNFGSMLPLGNLNPSLSAECFMSVFIVFVSHIYFAFQIYHVIPNGKAKYAVPGVVAFFGLVSFVGAIGCVVTMFKESHNILMNRSPRFAMYVGIAKGAAALVDIMATVSLCFYIHSAHANSGFHKTNHMLKRLIGFVLQRGILVTLIQLAFLIIFFTTSTHFAWLALHVNVTRVYCNTFFAMLNGRGSLREKHSYNGGSTAKSNTYINGSVSSKEVQFVAGPHGALDTKSGITMETTTEYSRDF